MCIRDRCNRILIDDVSLNMFTNICRGLFEKDKMLYAFMIAVGILRQAGKVRQTEPHTTFGAIPSTSVGWFGDKMLLGTTVRCFLTFPLSTYMLLRPHNLYLSRTEAPAQTLGDCTYL